MNKETVKIQFRLKKLFSGEYTLEIYTSRELSWNEMQMLSHIYFDGVPVLDNILNNEYFPVRNIDIIKINDWNDEDIHGLVIEITEKQKGCYEISTYLKCEEVFSEKSRNKKGVIRI